MLYLVKLDNTYKIGYSKDPVKRIKQFQATHIDIELISTKCGSIKDEQHLHYLCAEYHIKNELFKQDNEVIKIFNTYISNIESDMFDYKRLSIRQEEIINDLIGLHHSSEKVIECYRSKLKETTQILKDFITLNTNQ